MSAAGERAAIRADGVGFTYRGRPGPAIRDVSFDLPAGGCLLVVGPSGSGKSTLALAIAGLVPRDVAGDWAGSLTVGGLETTRAPGPELAARVGVVFQDPASQLVMERVEDDVAFGLESRAWPVDRMRARVPEALGEVGLPGLGRRRSTTLSGGQQQRLALAGALAPRPAILVLDEPTANLDPTGTSTFFDRLRALREARGATIVLVEHRSEQAWPLADLVLALGSDGRPIELGAPDEVLARGAARLAAEGIWLPAAVDPAPPAALPPAPIPGPPLVTALDVSFAYVPGRPVLDAVGLVVGAAERVALVGPNGSGKSTLARLLVGLLRPDGGLVRLGSVDPARLPAAVLARHAGYVFQEPEAQFLTARVADEVTLGLTPEERRRVAEVMDALRLPLAAFGDRSPYTLSGGEKRRLSLAPALVRRPDLLVLDEPTFGQDRRGYLGLLAILGERVASGTALIAATHDERLVRDLGGRTVALDGGRVVAGAIA
ncbi:MAG TPA: ATP-binding cassette domain-containing protein [Candidatus Limnocylindrales bacterium]|nr:ATP-binding cassette domain-containing protein [Candidatus Limnocylindrales bacterium]